MGIHGHSCYKIKHIITVNYSRARRRKETLATVGTQEFIINFIFNNSDIFGGISLNPIILRQNNKSMEIQPKFVIELDLIYVNR